MKILKKNKALLMGGESSGDEDSDGDAEGVNENANENNANMDWLSGGDSANEDAMPVPVLPPIDSPEVEAEVEGGGTINKSTMNKDLGDNGGISAQKI